MPSDNEREMFGSIHTHFESQYDTGNTLSDMILNFEKMGAKKVAVTEHGVFSSYEDLRDIVKEINGKRKEKNIDPLDLEIIPGIEAYVPEHLILIAKDFEGYTSLCKVISESNTNLQKGKPVVTLENLERNIAKGHVVCTSACIAGPFGHIFGLDYMKAQKKIEVLEKEIKAVNYDKLIQFEEEYEAKKAEAKELHVTQKELNAAKKAAKELQNDYLLEAYAERIAKEEEILTWLNANKRNYDVVEAKLKDINKKVYAPKARYLAEYKQVINEYERKLESGELDNEAMALLNRYTNIFGKDNFFFEIQNHGLEEENEIYNKIVAFAYRAGHPQFVASNDIHLGLRKDDPEYENALLRRNVEKFNRNGKYYAETEDDKEYVIKTDAELKEELLKIIKDTPEASSEEIIDSAIGNIEGILESCHVEHIKDENHYPKFCEDENAEFERLVREGVKKRFPNGFPDEEKYTQRLEYELNVIKTMGYSGYHLIVADYLNYGRLLGYLPTPEEIENAPLSIEELDKYITDREYPRIGYSIGPGRGSAVGSLCCYALGITDIDPIPYNLLFERFLNVERVSMPDIDSDFKTDIRDKVLDYCKARYGAECMCQIMTKAYGAAKGNIRLAARYLGTIEYEKIFGESSITDEELEIAENADIFEAVDTVSDVSSPEGDNENVESVAEQKNPKLKDYLRNDGWYFESDKLAKKYDAIVKIIENSGSKDDPFEVMKEDPEVSERGKAILSVAATLEGIFTNYGEHAAGTIISKDDLKEIIPLRWNSKKGAMETQCTMAQAEAKGLLKMDFLNLKNLNIITDIILHPTKKSDMDGTLQDYVKRDVMLKDPAIYRDIFGTGLTQGVFQFESDGMKSMLVNFKPENFEDIILLVSAYRPGPLDYIPEIIAQKWYTKFDGDYKKYSEFIQTAYPFSKAEYEEKKAAGLAYFYDENGKVLDYVPHSVTLKNEALHNILKDTYDVPIYQEQIMKIFQEMAGYSLGGADIVRRYMSKKKVDKLAHEKEAFIYGDEERGIPGCCKKHGITPEEADKLFEQLMPFAKYGFNKSHATAYAMVAMFTAYLKKYHTADFFRSSLNAVGKLDEIPPFVHEMPAFGLEFKGPSIMDSENEFTVENDNAIRFGLRHIKSFSEQNVQRSTTIEEFMELNPTVSLKMLEKYAQLGMFKECWKADVKGGCRVLGNRHECLRWINESAPLLKKNVEINEKLAELSEIKTELEEEFATNPTKETESLLKRNATSIKSWNQKKVDLLNSIREHKMIDFSEHVRPKETTDEILENRKWEVDALSIPFDIQGSLNRLAECKNKATFELLNKTSDSLEGKRNVWIPAVVLSVSDEKKTKKGNSYYEVSLMDRNMNITTRRFDAKPEVLDGVFFLTINDCKFFNCKVEDYRKIQTQVESKKRISFKASSDEKAKAMAVGGSWDKVRIAGNRTVSCINENTSCDDVELGE